MLGYIVVDIVTGGHSNDLAFEGIGSLLDPLRAGVLTVLLDESLELLGSTDFSHTAITSPGLTW